MIQLIKKKLCLKAGYLISLLMRILIIQQKYTGDVLMSSILCENLKKWNPNCIIDFVANNFTVDIIENNPFIDNIIIFKKGFGFLFSIRKIKYDYLIDCYSKIESNLIALFSYSKIKITYYKWYSNFIYNSTVKRFNKPDKSIELSIKNRLELLKPILGSDFNYVIDSKVYFDNSYLNNIYLKMKPYLKNQKKNILINVYGSNENKTLPIDQMIKLIEYIDSNLKCNLIMNYMPSQVNKTDKLLSKLNRDVKRNIINYVPNTLKDFIHTTHFCDAVLGNEGGAINIAKSIGKPTFSIFSPAIDSKGWHSNRKKNHFAVHLSDYFPNLFDNKSKKEVRSLNKEFYKKLKFELFKEKLFLFLKLIKTNEKK